MKNSLMITSVAVSATLLLQGCSVFRALGFVDRKPKTEHALVKPDARPVPTYVETGRAQLDGGNYGLAVDAFQHALAQGEPAAPALNGLGVSYAKIGRIDLAAEYFRRAMALEPQNERYTTNLALLLKSHAFEEALPRQALAALPPPAVVAQPRSTQAAAAPVRGRLTRVAPRQYEIHVRSGTNGGGAEMAKLERTFRPIIRIPLSQSGKPASNAPKAKR